MRLPEGIVPTVFEDFRLDPGGWRAAIVELCRVHRLECGVVTPFREGSNLVAGVDDCCVVKVFPPFHEHQWTSEWRVLSHLTSHRLPIALPKLLAHGTRPDGWRYVVLERLPGAALDECWSALSLPEKTRVLEQVGLTMATMHGLPVAELASLPPEWCMFLRGQKENCRGRHAAFGVPRWFVEGLDDFLRTWAPDEFGAERVILTGEYTPMNLLVARDEDGWRLTGMIDFGDAMIGPRLYDLLGPSMFSCGGDARLVGALFRGYFGEHPPPGKAGSKQLLALALLHRYANFDFQLRVPNWRDRVDSLDALAELVWPPEVSLGEPGPGRS